jgi:Family of unknown function (DUF6011)
LARSKPITRPVALDSQTITPGIYTINARRYLLRYSAVHMVRANGQPSRYVVARVAGAGLQVTGNGHGHEPAMHALATGQALQVEAHCSRCTARLVDPESIARGFGPECAKAVA